MNSPAANAPMALRRPVARRPLNPAGAGLPPANPDTGMLNLAVIGLVVLLVTGLPVSLFVGPRALRRAKTVEDLVKRYRRPDSDLSTVRSTRIVAWISIILGIPCMIAWTIILVGIAFGVLNAVL